MTIQSNSPAGLVLYLTPDDLRSRGLRAETLSAQDTLALTEEALLQAGLPAQEGLEIESFPDKAGLLLFVRLRATRNTVWRFPDFEILLAAARSTLCGNGETCLYRLGDHLFLTLEGDCPALSEFADCVPIESLLHACLQEYGTLLLSGRVFDTLLKHF